MGATPETTDQLAVIIDKIIKAAVTGGEAALTAYILTTPAAWLVTVPILKNIVQYVISVFGSAVYMNAADVANKVVIDLQVKYEAVIAAYEADKLKKAEDQGDQSAIQSARQDFESAIASLIHSDGSARP